MTALIWTLIGFFLGALPLSVWLGRLVLKTDIRRYGDGNPGGTNVARGQHQAGRVGDRPGHAEGRSPGRAGVLRLRRDRVGPDADRTGAHPGARLLALPGLPRGQGAGVHLRRVVGIDRAVWPVRDGRLGVPFSQSVHGLSLGGDGCDGDAPGFPVDRRCGTPVVDRVGRARSRSWPGRTAATCGSRHGSAGPPAGNHETSLALQSVQRRRVRRLPRADRPEQLAAAPAAGLLRDAGSPRASRSWCPPGTRRPTSAIASVRC